MTMNEAWSQIAADAIAHAARMAGSEVRYAAAMHAAPHVLMRPRVYPDGNMWCALYGENLQEGVAGFGPTPSAAAEDFDKNWRGQTLPTPSM